MKRISSIVIAISSLFVLPNMVQAASFTPEQTGLAIMRLHQSVYSANAPARGGDIWLSLRQDFRLNEVNASLVRSHENRFVANRDYFNRTLVRSTPYMYHIVSEVQRRGMPAEIALLPFIESAYVTKARSTVGASGLWQFMPATGRHYGLEQTPLYDGRHDIFAATDAALNYLQYLHGLFGDWTLALAAYNWGEGNVSRAIRRAQAAGRAPTYENINMPAETRNYVPKLLAVRNLVNNPQMFGLKLPDIKQEPYFRAVTVNTPLDIMAAAHLANISESEFLALNPAFKTPVFIPKGNRRMLLPVNAANTFEANYRESDPKTLLSWDVFTPSTRVSVSDLATQTGSTSAELKRLNGISGNYVNAGHTVLVNRNTMVGIGNVNAFVQADFDPTPDTFVEQAPVLVQQTPAPVANNTAIPTQQPALVANNTIVKTPQPAPVANNTIAQIPQPAPIANNTIAQTPQPAPIANNTITQTPQPAPVANNTITPTPQPAPIANNTIAQTPQPVPIANNTITQTPQPAPIDSQEPDEILRIAQAVQMQQQAEQLARQDASRHIVTPTPAPAVRKPAPVAAQKPATTRPAAPSRTDIAKNTPSEKNRPNTRTAEKPRNTAPATQSYKVASGDTLYSIAKRYNMTTEELTALNQIKNRPIRAGQTLKVSANNAKNTAQQPALRQAVNSKRESPNQARNNGNKGNTRETAQPNSRNKETNNSRNNRRNETTNARENNRTNTATSRNANNKRDNTAAKNVQAARTNSKPRTTNTKRR